MILRKRDFNINIVKLSNYLKFILVFIFFLFPACKENKNTAQPSETVKSIIDIDGSINRVRNSHYLYVGTDPSTDLPFIGKDKETKEFTGFEVEIAEYLAKNFGVNLKLVPTPWNRLFNNLSARNYDIALNAIELPEDDKILEKFAFSVPYYLSYIQIVVLKSDKKTYGIADFKKRNVGVIKNSVSEILLNETNRIKKTDIKIKSHLKVDELFDSLRNKEINGVLISSPFAQWYCLNSPTLKITGDKFLKHTYVIAVNKKDIALLNALNAILKKAKYDKDFKRIFIKWGMKN